MTFRMILKLLKHENPGIRKEGMETLHLYDKSNIKIKHIEYLIEQAAGEFPKPVGEWDDPSFVILQFVYRYNVHQCIPLLDQYFTSFSPKGQSVVLDLLLRLDTEESQQICVKRMKEVISDERIIFPLHRFSKLTAFEEDLVPLLCQLISQERYSDYCIILLNELITKNDYLTEEQTEQLRNFIQKNYQELKKEYITYDVSYDTKFVYWFWKENYFSVRSNMLVYLSLMKFFNNTELIAELKDSLLFKDPFLRSSATTTLLYLKEEVSDSIVHNCVTNIEARLHFYEDLKKAGLNSYYPEEYQKNEHFVESEFAMFLLFENIIEEVPSEIAVEPFVSTMIGTSYLCQYKVSEQQEWSYYVSPTYNKDFVPVMSGGFRPTTEEEVLQHKKDQSPLFPILDEIEHLKQKAALLSPLEIINKVKNKINYSFSPQIPVLSLISIALFYWLLRIDLFPTMIDQVIYSIVLVFFAIRVLFNFLFIRKTRISITGQSLSYISNRIKFEIDLQDIGSISKEKRKVRRFERSYFYFKTNYLVFKNKQGEEVLAIPTSFLKQEALSLLYKNKPLIEGLAVLLEMNRNRKKK